MCWHIVYSFTPCVIWKLHRWTCNVVYEFEPSHNAVKATKNIFCVKRWRSGFLVGILYSIPENFIGLNFLWHILICFYTGLMKMIWHIFMFNKKQIRMNHEKNVFIFQLYIRCPLFNYVSGYPYGLDRLASRFHCGNVYQEQVSNWNTKTILCALWAWYTWFRTFLKYEFIIGY